MDDDTSSFSTEDSLSDVFDRMIDLHDEVDDLVEDYKKGKDLKVLNKAISKFQGALQDDEDFRYVGDDSTLAELLWYRYQETGQVDDLNDAINKMENEGDDLHLLSQMLWARYERSLDPADMDDAVFRAERAVFEKKQGDEDDLGKRLDLLVDLLSKRFHITNNLLDLNAAINLTEKVIADRKFVEGDRNWVKLQHALAEDWETRAQRTNEPKDAERAVKKARMVVKCTKKSSRLWVQRQILLARTIWSHALMTKNAAAGSEALSLLDSVVSRSIRLNLNNPGLGNQKADLARMHCVRALLICDSTALEEAISTAKAAIVMTDTENPVLKIMNLDLQTMQAIKNRFPNNDGRGSGDVSADEEHSRVLLDAASWSLKRNDNTARIDDLNSAILLAELSQSKCPSADEDAKFRTLATFSAIRTRIWEATHSLEDLKAAISAVEVSVDHTSRDDNKRQERFSLLSTQARLLLESAKKTGNRKHLDQAIERAELVVVELGQGSLNWAGYQDTLASMLHTRYQWTGSQHDFDLAIQKLELATSVAPTSLVDQGTICMHRSKLLYTRYEAQGKESDLAQAVKQAEESVRILEQEAPQSVYDARACLAEVLVKRFMIQPDRIQDLESAMKIQSELMEQNAIDSIVTFAYARNLCFRYQVRGQWEDIETSIHLGGIARQRVRTSIAEHGEGLSMFAECLAVRFDSTGNTSDLEEAIVLTRMLLLNVPNDRNLCSNICRLLGSLLLRRYKVHGSAVDLEEAIKYMQQAVNYAAVDYLPRKKALLALADAHIVRYEDGGHQLDRTLAISAIQGAVNPTIDGENELFQAQNAAYSTRLAYWRFQDTGLKDDLDQAISSLSTCLAYPNINENEKVQQMEFLADLTLIRQKISQSDKLEQEVIDLRCQISKMSRIAPFARLRNIRQAVKLLIRRGDRDDWQKAHEMVEEGIRVLPEVVGRHLTRADQEIAVSAVSGFAAEACSISLRMGQVSQALLQLELGRGLVLGNLISSRIDLEELSSERLDLADRLKALREKAFTEVTDYHPRTRQHKLQQRRNAERDYRKCIEEIRKETSLKDFLADPTVQDLQNQATEGVIVIVNVTDISSDAIIVPPTPDKIRHIPLTGLDASSSTMPQLVRKHMDQYSLSQGRGVVDPEEKKVSTTVDFLSWLWCNCVQVVLQEIGCSPVSDPAEQPSRRVWWLGSGIASSFPFHAAGQYEDSEWLSDNTLAWCIPSYTPTIRALKYAKSRAYTAGPLIEGKLATMIVTMDTTPGEDPLDGVVPESQAVEEALRPLCRDEKFTCLDKPSADDVISKFYGLEVVHFACHGASDRTRPLQSHLLLQTAGPQGQRVDRLTADAIANSDVFAATIAFLSACSTAEIRAEAYGDESLHLASVFQAIGFPHVVGSQWTADDDICIEMARLFYGYLAEEIAAGYVNSSVAKSLHRAMVQLQVEYWGSPRLWAPYIHSGA